MSPKGTLSGPVSPLLGCVTMDEPLNLSEFCPLGGVVRTRENSYPMGLCLGLRASWEAGSLGPVLGHRCSRPYFQHQELAVCSTNSLAPNPCLSNNMAEGTRLEAPTNLIFLRTHLIFESWTGSQREAKGLRPGHHPRNQATPPGTAPAVL